MGNLYSRFNISAGNMWLKASLFNLVVVAAFGLLLRSKILFSMPFLNYKNTLHAHSHFAFGGWVTIAISSLMVYELLPEEKATWKVFNRLLAGYMFSAWGMLVSFLIQGYGFYSILFSTLFIGCSYVFAYYFNKAASKSNIDATVLFLSRSALIYMVLSSIGPFVLAYMLATKTGNPLLFKDAVYTYLHLQYNGYFALAVFALFINRLRMQSNMQGLVSSKYFTRTLSYSVVPSMFLCYLWHQPGIYVRLLAIMGAILLLLSLYFITRLIPQVKANLSTASQPVRILLTLSLMSFVLKTFLQVFTVSPEIGAAVFTNRPVIIGFLHLVLLSFISLYLIGHYVQVSLLKQGLYTHGAIILFVISVLLNELTLMIQGLDIMLMQNSRIFSWILWLAALGLVSGSLLLFLASFRALRTANPAVKKHVNNYLKPIYK